MIRKIDSTIPENLTLAGIPPLISTLTANNIIYLTPSFITYTDNTMTSIINDDKKLTWQEIKGEDATQDDLNTTIKSVIVGTDTSSIGNYTFNNCVSVTSIDIADSVSSIGYLAFNGCTLLTSINLPTNLKEIKFNTFYNCASLPFIEIPNSVTSIGDDVFINCTTLTSIILPTNLKDIGHNILSNCTSLSSITIPNSVSCIGDNAFGGCTSLTSVYFDKPMSEITSMVNKYWGLTTGTIIYAANNEIITVPVSTTPTVITYSDGEVVELYDTNNGELTFSIIENAHLANVPTTLEELEMPELEMPEVEPVIPKYPLITDVSVGSDITSLQMGTFQYCTSLSSVTLPTTINRIGQYVFNGTKLTSININKGIKDTTPLKLTMGNTESDKWWGLSSNTAINCSDGFIYIDKELMYGKKTILDYNNCDFILYFDYSNKLAIGGLNERYTGLTREYDNEIYVPHTLVKNHARSVFPETIGEIFTVANINNKNYNSTPKITIEYGVTNIDSYAFQNCTSVTDIEIPETVESIGAYAFENCNNLTAITIKGAKYIGSAAFYGCEKLRLQNIILPAGSYSNNPNALTELGDNVFLGLKSEMGPHVLQLDGYSVEDANNLFKASNNYAGLPTGSIITLQSGQEIWIGSNNIH